MSRFKIANIIAYGFVTLFSIYVLMPILVMVLTTFKSKREIFLEPLGIPSQFGISSFGRLCPSRSVPIVFQFHISRFLTIKLFGNFCS